MTRKQVVSGVAANAVFWGFLGLVVLTNGWAFVGLLVLLMVFAVGAIGVGSVK